MTHFEKNLALQLKIFIWGKHGFIRESSCRISSWISMGLLRYERMSEDKPPLKKSVGISFSKFGFILNHVWYIILQIGFRFRGIFPSTFTRKISKTSNVIIRCWFSSCFIFFNSTFTRRSNVILIIISNRITFLTSSIFLASKCDGSRYTFIDSPHPPPPLGVRGFRIFKILHWRGYQISWTFRGG